LHRVKARAARIADAPQGQYSAEHDDRRAELSVCGFVGGTEPDWHYEAALETIRHRGPDAGGLLLDGPVRVGFRRLSIIDLAESANQPFLAADGKTWIVFNGEIYGYRRLRAELEKLGHAFRTQSDTEVLLEAYLEWGEAFVEHVDGMFAIAIWDARDRKLRLYRDRPGIKPLYYFYDGKRFAFASELKAIETALAPAGLATDQTALYDFLGYRYVPAPKTLYRHCFKLLPGHTLSYDPASGAASEPRPHWRLETAATRDGITADDAAEELREIIDESVRDQMIADVPLGFFLSGGIDSSVVVAAATAAGGRVETFSIGFDSDEVSETPFARLVAEHFGTAHHEKILSQAGAQDLLPSLKEWFDEPFADESALPTFLVSSIARERVTVVLTGDGGDEVFGGYKTYDRFARYAKWPSWPQVFDRGVARLRRRLHRRNPVNRFLRVLEMGLSSDVALWSKIMHGMSHDAKAKYRNEFGLGKDYDDWWHYRQYWRDDLPLRTRLQYIDFHTFLPGLVLTKVDRTSMAVSLEARVPLLSRRLIEFSFSLPETIRYYGDQSKGILRHAYRDILPQPILERRKKGFGVPRYYLGDLGEGMPLPEHILRELFLEPDRGDTGDARQSA
jgi:asparagine synthase (glutamine-hydrolysing)